MSAISAPFGFRPSFHNSGQVRPKAYTIASAYAVNIFQGDPVKLVAGGTVELSTSDGTRTGTVAGITQLGILAGVEYRDALGQPRVSNFWPSGTIGTEIVAWVYDDPETLFDVQVTNPSPGTSAQTLVGAGFDWVPAAPGGSTFTGLSATQLSAEQSTSGNFQLTRFAGNINDSITDQYIVATVRINEHAYKFPTAAI